MSIIKKKNRFVISLRKKKQCYNCHFSASIVYQIIQSHQQYSVKWISPHCRAMFKLIIHGIITSHEITPHHSHICVIHGLILKPCIHVLRCIFFAMACWHIQDMIWLATNKDKIRNSEGPLQFGGFLRIIYQMLILVSLRQIIRRLVSYPPTSHHPPALFWKRKQITAVCSFIGELFGRH